MLPIVVSVAFAQTPPPLPGQAVEARWFYSGPADKGADWDLARVVAAVRANPAAEHLVWQAGWPAWKRWQDVPEIQKAVLGADTWQYSAGGTPQQLGADAIVEKVRANPGAQHLVWRDGMASWTPVGQVPELAKRLAEPPPVPAAAPPAPPPLPATPPALPPAPPTPPVAA
ncbi:MAG: GYF domain-containing protein, partial [Myxococcota bacterium]